MTYDDPETAEFTTAELVARLSGPHPEQWTDVIRALAQRTRAALDARGTDLLDEAAIVRNLAATVEAVRAITAQVIEADLLGDGIADVWSELNEHLDQAAKSLDWIAKGWL